MKRDKSSANAGRTHNPHSIVALGLSVWLIVFSLTLFGLSFLFSFAKHQLLRQPVTNALIFSNRTTENGTATVAVSPADASILQAITRQGQRVQVLVIASGMVLPPITPTPTS